MTIIAPLTAAGLGTVILRPLPDVQPFSIQSGYSFEGILSDIRTWLRDELVPYLQDSSAQSIFQSNVDSMVDRVNAALTDQSAIVTAALNTAVQEVITAQVPIADPIVAALLNSVSSATRQFAETHYAGGVTAPAPSGGDDTAVLTALINLYGTVHFREGGYLCNLSLLSQFKQPWLIGKGKHYTTLTAFDPGKPVVQFNGGSGSIAGGGIRGMFINGTDRHVTTTVGVAFVGCGGVKVEDTEIENCAVGVLWRNLGAGQFTEFCTADVSIYNCTSPGVYRMDGDQESFHGSGFIGETIIGMPSDSDSAVLSTVGNALPYNAPLHVHVFFSKSSQFLINYVNTVPGRAASFYGRINIENSGDGQLVHGSKVLFAGTITHFSTAQTVLGALFLCSKIWYQDGNVGGELLPVTERYSLSNAPTQRFAGVLVGGQVAMVTVHIREGAYDRVDTLLVYQSLYDGTGSVTTLWTPINIDSNNRGAPQYTWNNGLYIANANFTTNFTAFATMQILGGATRTYDLAQIA